MTPEQRLEIIRRLEAGEELSAEWARFLFPPEKREYELVYHGKEREEDILANTLAVPLQAVRTFANRHDFKTPLNAAIADSDPERRFIKALLEAANLSHLEAWLKSTAMRFYEIEYAWKKGEHPKRGKFNPDFFIKAGNLILVVEIKHDDELRDPSEENRKKNEYAVAHFDRVNQHLKDDSSPIRYKSNFLTQKNIGTYFQYLREGRIADYRSELDVKLAEDV